ncbi:hypothetical protein [uncultured Paludibaculum sp.]|uniref:hypothetical protein n=1 Tax=uncultured Paludibaculum sp. TaxID=1765020 RepID=UPI002AABEEEC|nr:hypothetical protein [uncultured Paludibaculum sp.]
MGHPGFVWWFRRRGAAEIETVAASNRADGWWFGRLRRTRGLRRSYTDPEHAGEPAVAPTAVAVGDGQRAFGAEIGRRQLRKRGAPASTGGHGLGCFRFDCFFDVGGLRGESGQTAFDPIDAAGDPAMVGQESLGG